MVFESSLIFSKTTMSGSIHRGSESARDGAGHARPNQCPSYGPPEEHQALTMSARPTRSMEPYRSALRHRRKDSECQTLRIFSFNELNLSKYLCFSYLLPFPS
ncbi:hypothetical protein QJS04_geneDACA002136 [Acorus gramineus]|uniref:Uncharacterized protein n=1 Tax=Acorus gramineus TaxID=55184 RepID=A0AAV9AAV3_ACOGR|nr:hypothetical protein QJS04_geneDACA002136 [Acorus gramineus]